MSAGSEIAGLMVIILASCAVTFPQAAKPGKNTLRIRNREQTVVLYEAQSTGAHRKVLFAPGDAGCRGFAVAIAQELAKAGYDAYCLDTLRYLESFTGPPILTTDLVASDFRQIAFWIEQGEHRPILLVGWSEGAGLGLAVIADSVSQSIFDGLIAIGTPEQNILAWRWTDFGAWITKKVPHEPTFKSADFVSRASPLPLFMIASTSNEYVTPEATRALFSAAREPKQLAFVRARDHKYSDNNEEFFKVLRQALDWCQRQRH